MSIQPKPPTLAAFLAWDERQDAKFEYRDGVIFDMSRVTDAHAQIVINVGTVDATARRRLPTLHE